MPPQIKLSEQCGRCPREELTTLSLEEAMARVKGTGQHKPKALVVTVDGKELVAYDSLCEECRGIIGAALEGAKAQTKKSARRFKRVAAASHGAPVRRAARGA